MRSILIAFVLFTTIKYYSQSSSTCVNENFEEFSLQALPPSTITIATLTGINGWTLSSGSVFGINNSCNLNNCCTNLPNSIHGIGTTTSTGLIDPNIGPSYPIFSYFGSITSPNAGLNYGKWFLKINDDSSNYGVHRAAKTFSVMPWNNILNFAFLPVLQNSTHANCDKPTFKFRIYNPTTSSYITNPQISVTTSSITSGPSCGTYSPSFIPCPLNSTFSYMPWRRATIDLSPFIGSLIQIEFIASDCSLGDHAGYTYIDALCSSSNFLGPMCPAAGSPSVNLFTSCGKSSITAIAPAGMDSYLWNGPVGWISNGATTQTVNLTTSGVYTLSMYTFGICSPIVKTFTLVNTPSVSVTLSAAQNTTCIGSNTISLIGNPSGGIYNGPNVTGNSFNPMILGNNIISYTYTDNNGCVDSAKTTINVLNCTTEITKFSKGNNLLHVFPTPFQDIIQVETTINSAENLQIEIINLLGEKIKHIIIKQNKQIINLDELSAGTYYIYLKHENTIISSRIIVKN